MSTSDLIGLSSISRQLLHNETAVFRSLMNNSLSAMTLLFARMSGSDCMAESDFFYSPGLTTRKVPSKR